MKGNAFEKFIFTMQENWAVVSFIQHRGSQLMEVSEKTVLNTNINLEKCSTW